MKQFFLSALSLAVLFGAPAWADKEPSASENLQNLLQQAKSLSGNFEQRLYDRDGHLLQTTEGEFVVERPGNFYWETLPPYEQIVVGNSATLWVYDPDLEQVTVRSQEQHQQTSPARLLSGDLENLDQHYQVTEEQKNDLRQFILVPTSDEGAFARLQLHYRNGVLVGLQFKDAMDQRTELSFSDVEVNPDVDEDLFHFNAPAGVDVIVDD